jgi:hypothetical protein
MTVNEILYTIAYCVFLIGAAKSFRENGSKFSIGIMSCGVLLDVLISILPRTGLGFLQSGIGGTNTVMQFAIILGSIVWILFLVAIFLWKKGKLSLFHFLIVVIELAWFIDFFMFTLGIYKFTLR